MTRKMLLIAGVAGLALTAPALAEKGGRGGDKPAKAEAQQGGGEKAQPPQRQEKQQAERPQRQERQQVQRAEHQQQRIERPQRIERQVQRVERQQQRVERQIQRIERPQRVERQQQQRIERQVQRIERPERSQQRIERQQRRTERQAQRIERPAKVERQQQRIERSVQRNERRAQRVEREVRSDRRDMVSALQRSDRREQKADRRLARQVFGERVDNRRTVAATRFDGQGFRPVAPLFSGREMRKMKPFKAKFDDRRIVAIGERIDPNLTLTAVPTFYASRYVDTPDYYYRYDDDRGYVYRLDRDDGIVRSLIPLFGGYGVGDPWPGTYYSSYVPLGYRDYFYDTPDYYYRNDGYGIYQVDGSTQLITALVALLTGQSLGIGQMLPASFGAYNVPLNYRSSYFDTDDSWYRYDDGFIYQVDPLSRRIEERYPLYADNYYVGDPWPVAYPDYNVPYGYQSTYYDTPQYHYRYANGGIYQVDPTNQVIMALMALLSGQQFNVGQPMPAGYGLYNVPLDYRDRYADSDDQWYRYADGNIYQVDPRTGLIEEAYPVYV